jgi:hypothetical protein
MSISDVFKSFSISKEKSTSLQEGNEKTEVDEDEIYSKVQHFIDLEIEDAKNIDEKLVFIIYNLFELNINKKNI